MSQKGDDVIELNWRNVHARVQGKLAITLTIVGAFVLGALWLVYSL